jgi:hypothetical protein
MADWRGTTNPGAFWRGGITRGYNARMFPGNQPSLATVLKATIGKTA